MNPKETQHHVVLRGVQKPMTDELLRQEIKPIMMQVGNHFDDDLEECIAEVQRLADNTQKGVLNSRELEELISDALMNIGCYAEARYHATRQTYPIDECSPMEVFMGKMDEIAFKSAEDVSIKRENANVNGETPMGVMLRLGSETAKELYLTRHISPRFAQAHINGDIHIHDLDFYNQTTTCAQIDLLQLFHGGFSTGHGMLREPQTIQSYAALACIAIQSNQNNQHGGQSVPNFDYAMAEGVAKSFRRNLIQAYQQSIRLLVAPDVTTAAVEELLQRAEAESGHTIRYGIETPAELKHLLTAAGRDLHQEGDKWRSFDAPCVDEVIRLATETTERDTYQAMEALIHNLNTMHSRAGAQVPFSSLNYGTDTSPEGRLALRSLLLATQAGLGSGETPIFPVQIFKVKDGVNFNEGDPNYDLFRLAIRTSAQRLFPNFSFLDAPFNKMFYQENAPETEVAYMGCRTRVMTNVYDPTRQTTYGRGNLSFTSINLPRLAIQANGSMERFYALLDEQLYLVRDQLLERLALQSSRQAKCFPFLMGQCVWMDADNLSPDDPVAEVLKHGTLSIGFIGLAEALTSLTGQHHGESEQSQQLGLEIISHMRAFTDRCSDELRLNFSLLATPAEGLSGRFVGIDKQVYGEIPGVTDKAYYTNSFHIPVGCAIPAYQKIQLEAPYHELTNGGHITYVEMDGDPLGNLPAFERIIRFMHDAGVGYGSINHPVDRDPVCGYTGIIQDECPRCGRQDGDHPHFERIRRITGYLVGTLDRWNDAKRAEEKDRVRHNIPQV